MGPVAPAGVANPYAEFPQNGRIEDLRAPGLTDVHELYESSRPECQIAQNAVRHGSSDPAGVRPRVDPYPDGAWTANQASNPTKRGKLPARAATVGIRPLAGPRRRRWDR
jgi:hypothetical protein